MLAGMNICDFDNDGFNELKACEIIGGTGSEFIWKYHITDIDPPMTTCTIEGEMNGAIYVSNVTVTLTAADNGSGVEYTMYKLDTGDWSTYSSPLVVSGDGEHIVMFYSVDRIGNTEQVKQSSFVIQQHPLLSIKLNGGKGVSVVIENQGWLSLEPAPWWINLSNGIILKGRSKTGVTSAIPPGEQETVTSPVFGFGRVTIVVSIGDVQKTSSGFVILIFVLGIK
jgi:hypothetical protein